MNKNSKNNKTNGNQNTSYSVGLRHLTVNTGHCVVQRQEELLSSTYEALKPMIHNRGGVVPGLPEFRVGLDSIDDTHSIAILKSRESVILCALAAGPDGAIACWEDVLRATVPRFCLNTIPEMPTTIPWMAVVMLPSAFLLSPEELMLLGSFEGALGLAILRYGAELN
jgi:hypothetical protein